MLPKKTKNYIQAIFFVIIILLMPDVVRLIPDTYHIKTVVGKLFFAFGPSALLVFMFFQNRALLKCIEEGKDFPQKILDHYGDSVQNLKPGTLRVVGIIALFFAFFWLVFIAYLSFSKGSTFLQLEATRL